MFVPGVVEEATIRRLARAVPGPLNIVAGLANRIDARTLISSASSGSASPAASRGPP
ncbi:hypothetical protein [Terrabacter sp. NPDC080008]|uniref:hypothetical protein n=1 Tax=Terrabacter sp. NPDC080008 TaxID=3155176 RepID=UPI00344F75B4